MAGFFSVSAYSGDAQDMVLPLVGTDKSGHDWHNMLTMLNLLDASPVISDILWSFGVITGVLAVLYYGWTMYAQPHPGTAPFQKLS